jgi:hypothetical protein
MTSCSQLGIHISVAWLVISSVVGNDCINTGMYRRKSTSSPS